MTGETTNIPSYTSGNLQIQFSNSLNVTVFLELLSATSDTATFLTVVKKNGTMVFSHEDTIPTYGSLPLNFNGEGIALAATIRASNFFATTVYSCSGSLSAGSDETITFSDTVVGFTISG